MSILDSEDVQLVIEMVIGSIVAIVGLWFLKRRSEKRNVDGKDDNNDSSVTSGSSKD
jgi:hypothetical protein